MLLLNSASTATAWISRRCTNCSRFAGAIWNFSDELRDQRRESAVVMKQNRSLSEENTNLRRRLRKREEVVPAQPPTPVAPTASEAARMMRTRQLAGRSEAMERHRATVQAAIREITAERPATFEKIATALNERGIAAPLGGAWSRTQVRRMMTIAKPTAG